MAISCSHSGLKACLVLLATMWLHKAQAGCLNATTSATATYCRTLSTVKPASGSAPCDADPGCGSLTDTTTGARTCGTLAQFCGAQTNTACASPQLAGICGTCVNLFPAASSTYCSGLSTVVASGANSSPCNQDPGCGVVATQSSTGTTRSCMPLDAYCAAQSDCSASNLGGTCGPPGSTTAATNTDTGSDFVCLAAGTPGTAAFCKALSTVTPAAGTSPCNADPGCGAITDSTTGIKVCVPLDAFCGVTTNCAALDAAGICRQVVNTGNCVPAAQSGTAAYCSALSTTKPAIGGLSPCTADPGCGILSTDTTGTSKACRPLDVYCAADNNCNFKCPPSDATSTGTTTTTSPRASGPTASRSPTTTTTGTTTRVPASAPSSSGTSGIVIPTGRGANPPARALSPSRSAAGPAPAPAPATLGRAASPVVTDRTGTAGVPAPAAKDAAASDTGSRVIDLGLTG